MPLATNLGPQAFLSVALDEHQPTPARIRAIEIPVVPEAVQFEVQCEYCEMSKCHARAMAIKERLLEESGIEPGQYGEAINELAKKNAAYKRAIAEAQERLKHLIDELEALLEGNQKKIRAFAG